MKFSRIALAAAVAAMLPLAAGAQTAGPRGQGAGNIETTPQTQPSSEFNQGIGGVGNQGQVGSGSRATGTTPSGATTTAPQRRGDTANTEGSPQTPAGTFSQGDGGVGNQGTPNAGTRGQRSAAADDAWRRCEAMSAGSMRNTCMRDFNRQYGAAGDPRGREFNRGVGGVGGVPPQ